MRDKAVELLHEEGKAQTEDDDEKCPGWCTCGMAQGEISEGEKVYWVALFDSKQAYFEDHKKAQEKANRKGFDKFKECGKGGVENFFPNMAGSYMGPLYCYESPAFAASAEAKKALIEKQTAEKALAVKIMHLDCGSPENAQTVLNHFLTEIPKPEVFGADSGSLEGFLRVLITPTLDKGDGPPAEEGTQKLAIVAIFEDWGTDGGMLFGEKFEMNYLWSAAASGVGEAKMVTKSFLDAAYYTKPY